MELIIEAGYKLFCVALAKWNATLIKKNKKVPHALQGLFHITSGVVFAFICGWEMFPLILLTARIFFTVALNLFRKLSPYYITPAPTAFTDIIEQKIFGNNGKLPLLIYVTLWLFINIIIIF